MYFDELTHLDNKFKERAKAIITETYPNVLEQRGAIAYPKVCKACGPIWPEDKAVSTAECPPCKPAAVSKQGTTNMRYRCDEEFDTESCNTERSYLGSRMYDIKGTKMTAARLQYKIDEIKPKTFAEAIERIKAGQYQEQPEDFQKSRGWWAKIDFIIWRGPDEKPDDAGYAAFETACEDAFATAMDQINTLDAKAGLEALNTFKAWTFTA